MMIHFDELWPRHNIKPDGVLHLGSNTGQERDVYVAHGVKEVIWVEAIPSVFQQLMDYVKDIPGTTCIKACVAEVDGKDVEFNVSNNESQSSSYLQLGHHKVIHPEVHYVESIPMKTVRVDSLLKDFKLEGKWLLNTDLQGAELQAFMGMGDLLNKFKWVYSEINFKECYVGGALVGEIDEYLAKFGFHRVETGPIVGETWTDALYCKI